MKWLALALVLWSGAALAADLPSPVTTPGLVATSDLKTICHPNYPASVRPSASYTNRLKRQQLFHAADRNPKHYEEDHRVPLEAGGDPRSPLNLWPQRRSKTGHCVPGDWTAECKDQLENHIHRAMCSHRITVEEGQAVFLGDWIQGYRRYMAAPN